jgi:hypothetical protein
LAYVYKQRAQLERSFRTAVADMKQSLRERKAAQTQPRKRRNPQSPRRRLPRTRPGRKPRPPIM